LRTFSVKAGEIKKDWFEVDAAGKTLGRLASEVARILSGKHKPAFSPHIDVGDHVVVVNAEKVVLTGDKEAKKCYYRHSGYPGALVITTAGQMRKAHPERLIEFAVKGMLPRNKLRRVRLRKLKVYTGMKHPHQAQNPQPLELPAAIRVE